MQQLIRKRERSFAWLFSLLMFGLLIVGVCVHSPLMAQNVTTIAFQCREDPKVYEQEGYIVKDISVHPLLKFMPTGSSLKEALAEAITKQREPSLRINQVFSQAGISILVAELQEALELRLLKGKTGFLYPRPHLTNCDPASRTLEVEYQILTVTRPSYLTASFELNDRKDKAEEQAGKTEKDAARPIIRPLIGYNRSRGIYGGTAFSFKTGLKPISKFDFTVSGSGSSAVAEASLTGGREYASGPLSYMEWKAGYRYSNIPTDTIRLKDATVLGQFFAATRSLGSHHLFFRFGSSLEGGNRQSNLVQSSVPSSTLVRSGYGAIKMYVGASLTGSRQDLKMSYGLQLGNNGRELSVDFRKQIFDAAYKARFLPRAYKPLQIDAQFTAGAIRKVSSAVPIGERFFGGNTEREFIQGDTWRIRSNPVIRSFPQNRLNRAGNGLPIGGENFLSINLTVAQTVWQKQLMPKEIVRDPDINAGLGGQLLVTRRFLREEALQRSEQIKNLVTQIGCKDKDQDTDQDKHCLSPIIAKLRAVLIELQSKPIPDPVSVSIGKLLDDQDADKKPIPDMEAAIAAAKLDPDAFKEPVKDVAALAKVENNPVEANALALTKDDPGDPTDPTDDTISLITNLKNYIATLQANMTSAGLTKQETELARVVSDLEKSRNSIKKFLTQVDVLRSYREVDINPAVTSLNELSTSGKKADQIIADIKQQIKPLRTSTKTELVELKKELDNLSSDSTEADAIRQKRNILVDFRDLLDATDTYCDKAKDAFNSANDFAKTRQFTEAKFDLERLSVGFGGPVSFISGVVDSIYDLRQSLSQRGLVPLWNTLHADALELLTIQEQVRSHYKKIPVPQAEARANQTVSYAGRVLDVFFHEINLVSVSPVLMFDAARLGPGTTPGQARFRYGIGSGVRFSLVVLDLTAGYSLNPNRRFGEERGAFVFSLDIANLFR